MRRRGNYLSGLKQTLHNKVEEVAVEVRRRWRKKR